MGQAVREFNLKLEVKSISRERNEEGSVACRDSVSMLQYDKLAKKCVQMFTFLNPYIIDLNLMGKRDCDRPLSASHPLLPLAFNILKPYYHLNDSKCHC